MKRVGPAFGAVAPKVNAPAAAGTPDAFAGSEDNKGAGEAGWLPKENPLGCTADVDEGKAKPVLVNVLGL